MIVKTLPQFLNKEHMVFIIDYTDDELMSIYLMKEEGKVERIESLGRGRVVWFYDSRDALMFMMKGR